MSDLVHASSEERAMAPSTIRRARLAVKAVAKNVLNKDTRIMLRRWCYAGTKYHCNVCGNRVRTMFTIGLSFPVLTELDVVGGETTPNDVCPICFSNCRARLLFEYVRRETGIFDSPSRARVLHVAPEYGILFQLRAHEAIDYLGVDLSPPTSGEGAEIERCDITGMGYGDNSFDLIICSHVLEHIPDDRLAMRELCRVLKPGGTAILQVPISASLQQTIEDPYLTDTRERERRFGQYDHVRIYGADYSARLRDSGFLVEVFDPTSRWGVDLVGKLRLNPRERIFLGRK